MPVSLSEKHQKRIDVSAKDFVVMGNHSYRSIENEGLIGLVQTFVDIAAETGRKIDVASALPKRRLVKESIVKSHKGDIVPKIKVFELNLGAVILYLIKEWTNPF